MVFRVQFKVAGKVGIILPNTVALNHLHDNVLVTNYPIYADIAEWMTCHLRGQTPATDSQ